MSKPPAKTPATAKNTQPEAGEPTSLEAELDRQIGEIVPQAMRAQVVARVTSVVASEYFSGPIAHPRHLREYEDICPGSADRIITMAEERNRHIMAMERKVLEEDAADQKRGMQYGAGLFCLLIVAAFVTSAMKLHPAVPGLFLGAATLGGIGLFIKGRNGK
ncbi:DUF2335 domain-containing protein [Paracoccus pantotrophus]|uniref:DUF2335 domain-containing protein n=1 Tax=Paracoccus pantotrophus TaxID=82367 RepID=A0A7H9BQE0_PARPN|nr:DUF2335 domain-containing protein [Paracoccus pantotrophus]QLH13560.1 DUF2335 domain-containing protein [Paracoccus pantotrophus]